VELYRLYALPPRRGVTAGRPVAVELVARRVPYRAATIDWGDGSATARLAGDCREDRGTGAHEDVRHTYRAAGERLVRALVQPCESGAAAVEVTLVLDVGPGR